MGGRGAVEVTADNGICLDDCFPAEDDALGSVDLGAAGDFVARVLGWLAGGFPGVSVASMNSYRLNVFALEGFRRHYGNCLWGKRLLMIDANRRPRMMSR